MQSSNISNPIVSDCHPNRIEIQGVKSSVHVKGTSWTGNTTFSHGLEANRFQLRPEDLFYVDGTEVMIRVGGMDQSEPSAKAEAPLIPDRNSSTQPAPASSPPPRLETGAAIMETPSKDRESAKIIRTVTSNAMKGKEDSQDWPLDIMKRATLSNIREAKQLNQSSPVPAIERQQQQRLPFSDITPSKAVCQDSIGPRNMVDQQSSERETDYSQSSVASARSHAHTRIKDESQASHIRHADDLLAIAQNNEQSSILPERNNPAATIPTVEEDTEDRTMLDLEGTTSRAPDLGAMRVQGFSDNETPERSTKRVKHSQSHDSEPTAVVSNNRDADVTTDDDESENGLAADARAEVAVMVNNATPGPPKKMPLASLDDNFKHLNSPLEETLSQAPHDGLSNSVKSISPIRRKRAAVKRATVPQQTTKQRTRLSRKSIATPEVSTEPSPSSRKTRSTSKDSSKVQESLPIIKVVFASSTALDTSTAFMKFLTAHGVQKVKTIDECDILCVGKEAELKRTSNLVLAVLKGKDVITDTWISESVNAKALLDLGQYKATDPSREMEWGTSLTEAIARGKEGLQPFVDWSFFFTPAVKTELGKGFDDMKKICRQGGAKSPQVTLPRKGPQEPCRTIIVASNGDDEDVEYLHRHGWKVYSKDLITLSILRGSLQLESEEFVIHGKSPAQSSKSKKRKR